MKQALRPSTEMVTSSTAEASRLAVSCRSRISVQSRIGFVRLQLF